MASLDGTLDRTSDHNQRPFEKLQRYRMACGMGCRGPAEITNAIRKVHDFLTVGAPAPLQEAAVEQQRLVYPRRTIKSSRKGIVLGAIT